jgi:hypothetical protein
MKLHGERYTNKWSGAQLPSLPSLLKVRAGPAAKEHVFEQEYDPDRGGDPATSIGTWEVQAKKLLEAHALEESIDDWQSADSV